MKRIILVALFLSFFGFTPAFAYDECSGINPQVPCSVSGIDFTHSIGNNSIQHFFNLNTCTVDVVYEEGYPGVYYNWILCSQFDAIYLYGANWGSWGSSGGQVYSSPDPPFNSVGYYKIGFTPSTVALNITRSPQLGGGVIVTVPPGFPEYQCGTEGQEECDFDVDYNAQVTLEAQHNEGYVFSHWEINSQTMGDTDGEIPITMSEDKDVVAVFKLDYLSFPLSGSTPFTALVSSVFDHSGNADYGDSDHQVTAFNGEANNAQTPYTGTTCYSKSDSSAFGSGFTYQGYGQAGVYYLCYNGHPGYDYAVGVGTNVYSAAPGKVTVAEDDPCLGYNVTIEHDAEYVTRYFHLDSIDTSNVQVDQDIPSGVRIGTSGDTGTCSDGAHLHFQVEKNGIPVDPYGWTGGGTDPYTRTTNVTLWE